jgi:hypothetical protein
LSEDSAGDMKDLCPPHQVRLFQYRSTEIVSSTASQFSRIGPHRLSTAFLLPWPWNSWSKPFIPDLRSLEVRRKLRFSEKIAFSSEVWCLIDNLVT